LDHKVQIIIPDPNSLRALRAFLNESTFWNWLDDVKNSWPLLLGVGVFGLMALVLAIGQGMPWLAEKIAFSAPEEWVDQFGKMGYQQMKQQSLKPSQLDSSLRSKLEQDFRKLILRNNLDIDRYRLHFHRSDAMGANAMAFPSGDIVLLDGMVELAGMSREELVAIFAHEIVHVEERHSVQMLVRHAGIGATMSILFGDLQTGAGLLTILPKILLEKGYSRAFETEADFLAVDLLTNAGSDPYSLIDALDKLSISFEPHGVPTLISSHPQIKDRMVQIEQRIQLRSYR